MFPLGSVLFTSMLLPLHLFEPRYLRLAEDVLAADREFGVVLIERGSEVGGGDQRSSIATVALVAEDHEFDDGRWALGCVGGRRIRVIEWLEDAPYPRAVVVDYPETTDPASAESGENNSETMAAIIGRCTTRLREAIDRLARLGEAPDGLELQLDEDPSLASHQLSAIGPFGPADKLKLLSCDGPASRLALLEELLHDTIELLDFRLS